jgi:hypothetical protein
MDLVRTTMAHPKIYPHITDDSAVPVDEFAPIDSPYILYLTCHDGDEYLGLWMFVQTNAVMLEVHTCLLPGHGFHRARQAAIEAAEWIWENTGCQRIWTQVPRNNRIARKFAEASGMVQFGTNPQCFLKGGKLVDLLLLGISRPREIVAMTNEKAVA